MGPIKVLILLVLQAVLVYCRPGDDFKFESRFLNDDELQRNLLQRMFKRGQGRGNTDFSDEEAEAIVERHNSYRSKTNPSASNMKHMVRNNYWGLIIYLSVTFFIKPCCMLCSKPHVCYSSCPTKYGVPWKFSNYKITMTSCPSSSAYQLITQRRSHEWYHIWKGHSKLFWFT